MLQVTQDSAKLLHGIMSLDPTSASASPCLWTIGDSFTLGTPSSLGVLLHSTSNIYSIIISPPSSLNMKIEKAKVRDYLKATTWTNHYDQPMKNSDFLVVTVLEVIVSWAIQNSVYFGYIYKSNPSLTLFKGCTSSEKLWICLLLLALYKLEVSAVIILVQKFQKSVQTFLINNCKHFAHFLQMVVPLLCHGLTLKNFETIVGQV